MKEQNIQSLKQSKASYLAMEKQLGSFFNAVSKYFCDIVFLVLPYIGIYLYQYVHFTLLLFLLIKESYINLKDIIESFSSY